MFFRLLGNFVEAAKDLRVACKIDFDEQADEWLKEVTPNVSVTLTPRSFSMSDYMVIRHFRQRSSKNMRGRSKERRRRRSFEKRRRESEKPEKSMKRQPRPLLRKALMMEACPGACLRA